MEAVLMHSSSSLPENYRLTCSIDLQNDKKTALTVNALAIFLFFLIGIPINLLRPVYGFFDITDDAGAYFLRLFLLLTGTFLYVCLHELTHAATMRYFGGSSVRFGFTGLYAYAGSEKDYFDQYSYVRIALAPITVWSVILALLSAAADQTPYFWVISFIQLTNISGAAGDLYVSWKVGRMSPKVYVMDTGTAMTVFAPEDQGESRDES